MSREADFIQMVRDMRAVQKRYFERRLHDDLLESKRLESEVDRRLADLANKQQQLFEG